MKKYFLIENDGGSNLLFWRPNSRGYTQDMTKAGIYLGNEMVKCPIINSDNLEERHEPKSFYIDINDIVLLGKMVTINKVVVKKSFKEVG